MILGAVWVGEHVLQWLINMAWITFGINLFILLPLAFFKKTAVVSSKPCHPQAPKSPVRICGALCIV